VVLPRCNSAARSRSFEIGPGVRKDVSGRRQHIRNVLQASRHGVAGRKGRDSASLRIGGGGWMGRLPWPAPFRNRRLRAARIVRVGRSTRS
jgi:hypothetical protein